MKLNKSLLLSVLLLGVAASTEEAHAQRTGLFSFGNFQQWVDLHYTYDGQRISGGNSPGASSDHRFDEQYRFSVDYTIYDHRILHGMFSADLDLNQEMANSQGPSTTSKNFGFDYAMSGQILGRSLFPVNFNRLHQRTSIQQSFAPSYSLQTDSNYVDFSLKNKFLPVRVSYTSTTTQSSGLTDDRNQKTDILNLEATHVVGDQSRTDFALSSFVDSFTLKSGTASPETRKYELQLRNQTILGDKRSGRSLDTNLLVTQSSSFYQDKGLSLTEVINYPLGKALTGGGDFGYSDRETTVPGSAPTKQRNLIQHGWLQHQLFESLSTRVDAGARQDHLATGSENDFSMGVGASYMKKLPWQGNLQLTFSETYQLTDRNLGIPSLTASEEYPVVLTATVIEIQLAHTDVDRSQPIRVVNNSPASTDYLLVYQEGTDYEVLPEGNRTKIRFSRLPGTKFPLPGEVLRISYSYLVNPQVKYSSTTTKLSGTAYFRDGRYRMFGSWSDNSESLISGRADAVKLSQGQLTSLGFEVNTEYTKYGAEAEFVDTTSDKHQSYLARYSYRIPSGRSSASINLTDRYVVTDSVASIGSSASYVNASNLSLNYSRPFLQTGTASLTGNYTKSVGTNIDRDDVVLVANLRWVFGKLTMTLFGQQEWRMGNGVTTRSDQVRLSLLRYF